MTGLFKAESYRGSLGQEIVIDLLCVSLATHAVVAVPPDGLLVYGVCLLVRKWSRGVWKKDEVLLITFN